MIAAITFFFRALIIAGVVRFVLSVVGVGVISYIGYDAIGSKLSEYAGQIGASGPPEMIAILGLAGFGEGINLILSGVNIRIAMISAKALRVIN